MPLKLKVYYEESENCVAKLVEVWIKFYIMTVLCPRNLKIKFSFKFNGLLQFIKTHLFL